MADFEHLVGDYTYNVLRDRNFGSTQHIENASYKSNNVREDLHPANVGEGEVGSGLRIQKDGKDHAWLTGPKSDSAYTDITLTNILVPGDPHNHFGASGIIEDPVVVHFDSKQIRQTDAAIVTTLIDHGLEDGRVKLHIASVPEEGAHAFLIQDHGATKKYERFSTPMVSEKFAKQFAATEDTIDEIARDRNDVVPAVERRSVGEWLSGTTKGSGLIGLVDNDGVLANTFSYTRTDDTITLQEQRFFDSEGRPTHSRDVSGTMHIRNGVLDPNEVQSVLVPLVQSGRLEPLIEREGPAMDDAVNKFHDPRHKTAEHDQTPAARSTPTVLKPVIGRE